MPVPVLTQADAEPTAGLTPHAAHLVTGMAVGRYVLGQRLGEGGMGVVYLAQDRLLDRKVALKVLKARDGEGPDSAGQDRLFAEARKLAQLQDPNIVAVYDVGTFVDQVYFAMEYMPGSLRGLLAEGPPTPEVGARRLRLLLEAGRGLAAAHRAGIVHRDFKPDNVLLDAEGRARVSDFGLALPVGAGEAREGTPGYLPPGASPALASPASDQYAFCATAWEALTGALPGRGEGAGLSPHLRRVLQRGLADQPEARYPSMEALLQALEADPARTRRNRLLAGGGVVAVLASLGVAGAALSRETPRQAQVRRCQQQVKAAQAALWGPPRQAEVGAAFGVLGAGGTATFERVQQLLGPEVEAWAQRSASACAAPEDAPGRRGLEACLAERRLALGTLSQLFAGADADVVANAVTTTSLAVVPVALCRPEDAGGGTAAPVEAGEALRPRLARALVLFAAGRYGPAREAAEAVGDDAQRAGAWHVVAEARLLEGRVGARLRQPDAEDVLRRAITVADRAQADEQRASGWVALANWLAVRGRDVEARLALESASAVVARLGRPPLLEAERLTAEGRLETERAGGSAAEARRAFEQALELRSQALPASHPLVINALANWATVLPPEERLPWQEQVLARREEAFGPQHPETAAALVNLGSTALELSRCAEAEGLLGRARAIQEAGRGEPLGLGRIHAVLARLELQCRRAPPEAWREGMAALTLLHQGGAPDLELKRQLGALLELRPLAGRPAAEAQELQEELDSLDEEVTTRQSGAPPGP
jgi:tetratricopeptide (TPR) repeat protein